MKKQPIIYILLFLLLAIVLTAVLFLHLNKEPEKKIEGPEPIYPELIVNGKMIEDEHVYIIDRDGISIADIPLVKVLSGLGVPVEWENDDTAHIQINNQDYTLSLTDKALYKSGTTKNCIVKGEGLENVFGLFVYKDVQDLYFDNYAMEYSLNKLGMKIKITLDMIAGAIIIEIIE